MMRIYLSLISLVWLFMNSSVVAAENWSVRIGADGIRSRAACLLESASQRVNDGQTTTPIKLVYNGEVMIAVTKSNIDLSYKGGGLQVDENAPHAVGNLHKKTNVIFDKSVDELVKEFINGKQVSLVLGFWPSWPKTKTVTSRFSLQGFSRAYRAFEQCQKTGVVKK